MNVKIPFITDNDLKILLDQMGTLIMLILSEACRKLLRSPLSLALSLCLSMGAGVSFHNLGTYIAKYIYGYLG